MVVRKRWVVAAVAVGAVVAIRLFVFPTAEIHYRLTAHFENSQGEQISAEGVWSVYLETNSALLTDAEPIAARVSGDAIRIENNGHMFWMLLSGVENCTWKKPDMTRYGNGPSSIIFQSFGINPIWSRQRKIFRLPLPGLKAELGVCDLPQIVRFDNANDPMSARPVLFDPDGRASCCDLVFKSATIEILRNSDKITETDVRKRFPWVPDSSPERISSRVYWPKGQDIPREFSLTDTSLSIRGF